MKNYLVLLHQSWILLTFLWGLRRHLRKQKCLPVTEVLYWIRWELQFLQVYICVCSKYGSSAVTIIPLYILVFLPHKGRRDRRTHWKPLLTWRILNGTEGHSKETQSRGTARYTWIQLTRDALHSRHFVSICCPIIMIYCCLEHNCNKYKNLYYLQCGWSMRPLHSI